jgi:hypothetical protein
MESKIYLGRLSRFFLERTPKKSLRDGVQDLSWTSIKVYLRKESKVSFGKNSKICKAFIGLFLDTQRTQSNIEIHTENLLWRPIFDLFIVRPLSAFSRQRVEQFFWIKPQS